MMQTKAISFCGGYFIEILLKHVHATCAGPPSWSRDLDRIVMFRLPHILDVSCKIWLQLAQWSLIELFLCWWQYYRLNGQSDHKSLFPNKSSQDNAISPQHSIKINFSRLIHWTCYILSTLDTRACVSTIWNIISRSTIVTFNLTLDMMWSVLVRFGLEYFY